MRPPAATALLIVAESALLALPLLPAMDELLHKRDAKPLEVIQKHAGDITYFARGFRSYLGPLLGPLRQCIETRSNRWGRLKNGEEYVLLGDDRQSFVRAANLNGPVCASLIAAGIDVTFPSGLTFAKEIYAAKSLVSGQRNAFRAILCDEVIHLQPGSESLRWAHAVRQFRADSACSLYGRVSSDCEILLAPGCTFQRLHAPRIALGYVPGTRALSSATAVDAVRPMARRLIDGDFHVPPGELIPENLVARGTLRIGAGARMLGSVKGHSSVVVEEKAVVCGSLISSGELRIGRNCQVGGPILAEHRIAISPGTICGTPEAPTTVSSPVVHASEGSLFHGTLWARETGQVLARP